MALIKDGKLVLSDEEKELVEEGKEFDLIPNQKGIYLLIEKELEKEREGTQVCVQVPSAKIIPTEDLSSEKEQVVGFIRKRNLADLVEGKFERGLDEKQRRGLLELVMEGRVYVFKLNDSYKKGVYKINEDYRKERKKGAKKESEDFGAKEKKMEEYALENDGMLVVKNEERVKRICSEHEQEIKDGKLKGLKSFDGNYYIIENELLEKYLGKAVNSFAKTPSQNLVDLAKGIGASQLLARVVCEFLKDEGELIERKKGEYSLIT